MTRAKTRKFRVSLYRWDVYRTVVTAYTPEHAEEIARRIYESSNTEGFDHYNGGDEGFQVDELEDG